MVRIGEATTLNNGKVTADMPAAPKGPNTAGGKLAR
jgi:hypothetical protein